METRNYKYRLYSSKQQRERLFSQLDLCCELYNALLQKSKEAHKEGTSLASRKKLYEIVKETKDNNPQFKAVYSQVLQNCADRLSKAYNNFFRRVKKKAASKRVKTGFPRFKKRFKSLTYPQFGFNFKSDRQLHVSKIGNIPITLHRAPKGRLKTMTIQRNRAGHWFAVFTCIINV